MGSMRNLIYGLLNKEDDELRVCDLRDGADWSLHYCSFVFPSSIIMYLKFVPFPKNSICDDKLF